MQAETETQYTRGRRRSSDGALQGIPNLDMAIIND